MLLNQVGIDLISQLGNSPLWEYTTIYLFNLLLMDIWVPTSFWLLWKMLQWPSYLLGCIACVVLGV